MARIPMIAGFFLAAATTPFLAEGGRKQVSLAQTVDSFIAAKNNDFSAVTSRNDFISFNFNRKTKKYTLNSANEEDIRQFLKDREGANKATIEIELKRLADLIYWINEKIAPLEHKLLPLQEKNELIPDTDGNDPKVLRADPILFNYGISLVQSVPFSVRKVNLDSVAIRPSGQAREKVLSFKENVPKKFEEPNGEQTERMVIYPPGTRVIFTQGKDAYFVNVK